MKIKKYLTLLLVVVMLFPLVSCSRSIKKDNNKTTTKGTSSQKEPETSKDKMVTVYMLKSITSNDGTLVGEFGYDSTAERIKYLTYSDGTVSYHKESVYDAGRLMEEIDIRGGITMLRKKYEYDSSGNVATVTSSMSSSKKREEYTYDADGKPIVKATSIFRSAKWRPHNSHEFIYDIYGRLDTEIIKSSAGELKEVLSYQYDGSGKLVQKVTSTDEAEQSRCEYTYDQYGNEIKYILYANGAESTCIERTYDSNGNLLRYFTRGVSDSHYEYEYDDNGNLLLEVEYSNTGEEEFRHEYVYNNANNIIKYVRYGAGEEFVRYESIYDTHGNLAETIFYVDNEEFSRMKYEYGNEAYPTKRIIIRDGVEETQILQYESFTVDYERARELQKEHNTYSDLYNEPYMMIISN